MNRQECRTKRIDSVCAVTWIPLCARDGSVIKWGRGKGETLSIHVVWTQCALGLMPGARKEKGTVYTKSLCVTNLSAHHLNMLSPMETLVGDRE